MAGKFKIQRIQLEFRTPPIFWEIRNLTIRKTFLGFFNSVTIVENNLGKVLGWHTLFLAAGVVQGTSSMD